MPGEPILIVDDTPINLKLTRILLLNEGYKVLTAGSAEEALELLRSYHPHLVLADVQLPGIDGLELTRRIKEGAETRDIAVIALTAYANPGDEQKAAAAGCDGYLTKPIDTRRLGMRIREFLDLRAKSISPPEQAAPEQTLLPAREMEALKRRFLNEGMERTRELLASMDERFDADEAGKAVHQWAGAGGLLGYAAIAGLAREVEAALAERPLDNSQLRESLTNLALAFNSPKEGREAAANPVVLRELAETRVALVGLPSNEALRMSAALEPASAAPVIFDLFEPPDVEAVRECSLAVVYVSAESGASPWLDPESPIAGMCGLVFVGSRDDLLALRPEVQAMACELLMGAWQPEEALVRLAMAKLRRKARGPAPRMEQRIAAASTGRPVIVLADDDPTALALVGTTLRNFGMDCQQFENGSDALEAIKRLKPSAAVLDVNMPGMNGYSVLASVREEKIPVRVLLLTARQQEDDVLRGFALGADDYVLKPFSPLELVARVKRLLGR